MRRGEMLALTWNDVTEHAGRIRLRGVTTKSAKTRYVPPYNLALAEIGLGHRDQALSSLARACKERDVRMVYLRIDPAWEPLRSDPRFDNLLRCTHMQP